MRKRLLVGLLVSLFVTIPALGQSSESFDILKFTVPKGWQKESGKDSFQLGKEDANGGICLLTIYKSILATDNPKENFSMAWESLVKQMVTVKSAPQKQPPSTENGWITESGFAQYESDGKKGLVLLVTASGGGKMINLVGLMNTAAYQQEITTFLGSIVLPKVEPVKVAPTSQAVRPQPARKSSFKFSTSNFDDGWTSTEQEDWVEVVKGNIKVLIHYPKAGTIFPADPEPLTNAAWNILVAPRYSNLKNYKTASITTYNRPYLGMGNAAEKATGKQVFVLLFRQGNTGWLEFVAPDKNSFIQQYKFDPETIRWDSESDLLNPLIQMVNYNKFAVAESDFNGTWTSDFTGVQQLYSVYTGNYAGMNVHQSNEEFVFGAGNSYSWKLLVVSGMVGSTNYAKVNSAGRFSVLNNWQIQFSKIESGPKTYNAFWSCIKGARLLHLLDAKTPGSGIYDVFGKK
ncbi:MAG TPA: hypothetical protein PLK77_04545 [Pyrinomonadaceae bacterium]|nr:hypothetical protein [Pyrinomonadaceae bacterium]